MAVDWVRLQLDLEAFDAAQFLPYLRRCQHSGIDFTTMADVGDAVECRRALYALNRTCSSDSPARGHFYPSIQAGTLLHDVSSQRVLEREQRTHDTLSQPMDQSGLLTMCSAARSTYAQNCASCSGASPASSSATRK